MVYQKLTRIISEVNPQKGGFELSHQQLAVLKKTSEIALAIIATASVATVSFVAPNLLSALNKIHRSLRPHERLDRKKKELKAAKAFYYLREHGLLKMVPEGGDIRLILTEEGKHKAQDVTLGALQVPKAKHWMRTWWQIAADIPTQDYRSGADKFRQKLKELGFYPLQRTLWFYPYDPRREIAFIVALYGIEKFVTVMEVKQMDAEDELKLRKYFHQLNLI